MRGILLCVSLLSSAAGTLNSQVINPPIDNGGSTDTTEWRGWAGVSFTLKPSKSLAIDLEQQWRWNDDFSSFDRQLQQLGCSWSPRWNDFSKAQSIGVGLRHTSRPDRKGDVQGVDRYLRVQFQYNAEVEVGRWEFKTRIRFQRQKAIERKTGDDPEAIEAKEAWRFKGVVAYNIRGFKWDPVFAVERFVSVVPNGWNADGGWRLRLATGRKLGKRQKVRLFVQRDWEERYNPAPSGMSLFEVGAGIDDLRTSGAVDWTAGVQWCYRFKLK